MASKTVLVIDADSETEQFIASTLEAEGYLVFAVPGGDVGAEMAQKVSPSLIFVYPGDTSAQGMDVCRTIRGYESLKTVPIILLAAGPAGTDLGPYGVVDSVSLPVGAGELLEKTEKAIGAKSPVVLRVKEKAPSSWKDKAGLSSAEAQEGELPKSRLSDLSEIEEMGEEGEDVRKDRQKDLKESVESSYFPEGQSASGKKSKKVLVALLVVLLIVIGVAGALFYSGMIPGVGPQSGLQPPRNVAKAKKPKPSPAAEPEKQPAAGEKTVSEPAAVQKPPAAATSPQKAAGKPGVTASATSAAASAKAVPAERPSGKMVYSVQVGVFKSEANAGALTKKLKEKGYDAFTMKGSAKDKGTVYRVLVGKFDDRKESQEMAARIGKKENIKAVIFSE